MAICFRSRTNYSIVVVVVVVVVVVYFEKKNKTHFSFLNYLKFYEIDFQSSKKNSNEERRNKDNLF